MIAEAVRQRLRWVTVQGDEDLARFPDFMIIGPQRTGTTWLHAHLRTHPDIFLSEPKELYFFSSLKTRDPKRFVSDELSYYLRFFRDPLWRRLAKTGLVLWKHRQLYWPRVRGEATASYAALDADVIAEIAALRPDLKVILMIRNPIERAWSHAKKDLVRNRKRRFDDVGEDEFRAFFSDPYQRRCAAYAQQVDTWSAHLRPGHVFTGFFDDMTTRPEALMLDVMRFLGVRADTRYIDASVRSPINPTETKRIPPQYESFLRDQFADDLRSIKERFGLSW
ncbi:MAG: sulfotransferase family protein [Candidatus Binatia bacterium]